MTILFAIANSYVLSHRQNVSSDRVLTLRMHENRELTALALGVVANNPEVRVLDVELNQQKHVLTVVDVGGLIDLNTASPELLSLVADELAVDVSRYRNWRDEHGPLVQVSDFLRATRSSGDALLWLESVATVHSGRRGVSPEHASLEVLELVTRQTGTPEILQERMPENMKAPSSGTNFNIFITGPKASKPRLLGTVHIGPDALQSRVMAIK